VTSTDLAFRQALPADAERVADLYSAARVAAVPMMPPALHSNAEDRVWMASRIAGDSEVWLAERGEELLGYLLLTRGWLDHLFVRPGHLGHGVGSALLDLAKALRPDGFGLWVFESNDGARRFYARHGLLELERTDGSANEEKAPDIRLVWPGASPRDFLQRELDEVESDLGAVLARRRALTAALLRLQRTQDH